MLRTFFLFNIVNFVSWANVYCRLLPYFFYIMWLQFIAFIEL